MASHSLQWSAQQNNVPLHFFELQNQQKACRSLILYMFLVIDVQNVNLLEKVLLTCSTGIPKHSLKMLLIGKSLKK